MFLKPRHILQGLIVTPWDLAGGWKHLIGRWRLQFGLIRNTHYVDRFRQRGIEATVKTGAGGTVCCHFCGHAIVKFDLPSGWTVETCSAQVSEKHFSGKHFETWEAHLPRVDVTTERTLEPQTNLKSP